MSPSERRGRLVEWMLARDGRRSTNLYPDELEVSELDLYDKGHLVNPRARAHRDLEALRQDGKVRRLPGRPARWEALS